MKITATSQIDVVIGTESAGLQVTSTGGTLKGSWVNDGGFTVSDRRLKDKVRPLLERLSRKGPSAGLGLGPLRELRPVRFRLHEGTESKLVGRGRVGFVAQELQRGLPELVRGEGDAIRAVAL